MEELIKIAKKIQNIEDKDADYINNKKWQQLKQYQDILYYLFAKRKIILLKESKNPKILTELSKYKKFVDKYEKKI